MDALAHLSPATKARRALLNDTMRALLKIRPAVTQLLPFDPDAIPRLKTARRELRTLLHRDLPGFKT
jgi:hypothetical protein